MTRRFPATIASATIVHPFHADGIAHGLDIEPDDATRELFTRRRLAARIEASTISVYQLAESILPERIAARFVARSRDPWFEMFTECPKLGSGTVLHVSIDAGRNPESKVVPVPGDAVALGLDLRQRHDPPRLVVDLPVEPVPTTDSVSEQVPVPSWTIAFAPRSFRWKYYLLGEFAREGFEIVDAGNQSEKILFSRSSNPAPSGALAWISESPIPAREVPTPRLQLRDTRSGRVVVKRLPNADFRNIGRETIRPGESVLVAEAYVNP